MIFKRYTLLGILIYISSAINAQSFDVDSLMGQLEKVQGKNRTELLNNLGWELKYSDINASINYSKQALELAIKYKQQDQQARSYANFVAHYLLRGLTDSSFHYTLLLQKKVDMVKDDFWRAKMYNLMALAFREQLKYPEAMDYHQKALEIFKEINDQLEVAGVMNNLGLLYRNLNLYNKELETYHDLIKIEKKLGNKVGLARTYNNMGDLYNSLNDSKNAIKYFREGGKAAREAGNQRFLAAALHGLGTNYIDIDSAEAGIAYLWEANKINKANHFIDWEAFNYVNLSNIYLELDSFEKAYEMTKKAQKIFAENNIWKEYYVSKAQEVDFLILKKDYKKALETAKEVETFAREHDLTDLSREIYWRISLIYRKTGQFEKALEALDNYRDLSNQLNQKRQEDLVIELNTRYEVEKKQKENERLKAENSLKAETIKRQKNFMSLTAITLIFAIAVIILIYVLLIRGRKSRKLLEGKNKEILLQSEELKKLNATKDRLFSIIAHDLKNTFHALIGYSLLLKEDVDSFNKEEIKTFSGDLNQSAQNAYDLLENLLEWSRSQSDEIEFKPSVIKLTELVENTINIYSGNAQTKNIQIGIDIEPETKVFADGNMLQTVVRNLVNNAIKFTRTGGKIEIVTQLVNSHVQLEVKDNGVGISQENIDKLFRVEKKHTTRGTAKEKGTGLGLLLCKEFVEKNGGKIWVKSQPGEGSTFGFTIPVLH